MKAVRLKDIHYAWVVLLVCTIFFTFSAGTLINCNGLFHTAICEDTGWKYSKYIVSNLFYGGGSLIAILFVDKIFKKYSVKWILVITTAIFGSCFACRAFMNSIAAFSVLNLVIGITGAFMIYVPVPILINRWFYKSKGFALGVAAMSSGLGGAIASPLLAGWIAKFGWRTASIINGGLCVIIVCPLLILFLVDDPKKKGLTPYGQEELDHDAEAIKEKLQNYKSDETVKHHRHYEALFNKESTLVKVLLCVIFGFLSQLFATLFYQFSNLTIDLGYGLGLGATLVSVCMVANMAGKSVQGYCMDRFGKRITTITSLTCVMLSIFALLAGRESVVFLFIGAIGVGVSSANSTIVPPLLVDAFSKGEEYSKNFSKVTFGTYIGAMFASYIPGILREASGSYESTFIIYGAAHLVCIAIVVYLLKGKDWA